MALAEASKIKGGPHPGVVILDEPQQQNPDDTHVDLLMSFLESAAGSTTSQVVVTTYLHPHELTRLKTAGVHATELRGEHFLELVPEPPTTTSRVPATTTAAP